MAFRTFFITKRKIAAVICAAAVSAVPVSLFFMRGEKAAETVFNSSDEPADYEKFFEEMLPAENSGFDLKGLVSKIIGFDTERPETVMSEFSSVFDNSSASAKEEVKETDETDAYQENTPEPQTEDGGSAVFPSKAEIASGMGLELNNATAYTVDLQELCTQELDFSVEKNSSEPQVLIVHTHTTECFDGDAMSGETERNVDDEKNIIAVGNVIADVLESNGIHCVHDKTVHDYPSYQGAYTRSLSTMDYNLKQYPEIKIVLDIHRDAYIYPDGRKLTVSCEQNGVSTAQVMLVLGTDSLGLSHPEWRKNLSLAAKLQSAANIMYPGMMRPINLRRERFNMHITSGSLLIEIGSNGNTLDEAKEGGKNIANALAAVLTAE